MRGYIKSHIVFYSICHRSATVISVRASSIGPWDIFGSAEAEGAILQLPRTQPFSARGVCLSPTMHVRVHGCVTIAADMCTDDRLLFATPQVLR